MKVAIVIITYNCPELFLPLIEKIKKHCKDDFEIVIIDNSTIKASIDFIKYHSLNQGLQRIKVRATSENGSDSHSFAANLSYQKLRNQYDYFFYLDHDCFPVKDFSVIDILGEKQMAGIPQQKEKLYYWPGCLMFKNQKEGIDFTPQPGLDTGGSLWYLIEHLGEENLIFFDEVHVQNPEFNKSFYNFYSEINEGMFIHTINASNWNNTNDHRERINSILNLLEKK